MSYITFVVKGQEQYARERMFTRMIVAETIHSENEEQKNYVVFKAKEEYRDAISSWFCEQPAMEEGYGYPDGTCLIYSTHEE